MLKTNTNTVYRLIKSFILLISVAGFVLLQGCSGSDDPVLVVTPDQDPKGYYDSGTAAVKLSDNTTVLGISDLQGMVSGNRFMLISVSETLLYDGTITAITGNTYTATVNIYEDGVLLPDTATVSGSITSASSMTGTLTGVGAGNGTFSLTYSLNNSASALVRVSKEWQGAVNGGPADFANNLISLTGVLSREFDQTYPSGTPVLEGCVIDSSVSTVLPVVALNAYDVSIALINCTDSKVNGAYTGLAATQTAADQTLIIAFSNTTYSGSGSIPFNP